MTKTKQHKINVNPVLSFHNSFNSHSVHFYYPNKCFPNFYKGVEIIVSLCVDRWGESSNMITTFVLLPVREGIFKVTWGPYGSLEGPGNPLGSCKLL